MVEFLKMLGASLLAKLMVLGIVVTIIFGIIGSFSEEIPSVPKGSVLVINLDENIVDSPHAPQVLMDTSSSFGLLYSLSIYDIMLALETAAADPTISAVYINASGLGDTGGLAHIEELRGMLKAFKENSDKPIIAYQDTFSQELYWLASVADEVYMNPAGSFDWRGLASQSLFFKGAIDKLDVDVQVVRHGTFKAAVEPYLLKEMSPENRAQTKSMIDGVWSVILDDVAASRDLGTYQLNKWAEDLSVTNAQAAASLGLVDGLLYEDEVRERVAELVGKTTPNYITLGEYFYLLGPMPASSNQIAIVYADGEIVDGYGGEDIVGSITTAEQIRRAREDKNIKAVVLRVNSPGGSALASEVLWRELELLGEKKPLVVSMSNYAASGGYYISSPAHYVLANRTTITGSIGVFGLIISGGRALEEGLGVTSDVVRSNTHADMGSMFRPLSPEELEYMQASVEEVYDTFVERVADGRGLEKGSVEAIGEGRVWGGEMANILGLTDGNGGLRDAVVAAATLADVEEYSIVEMLEEEEDILAMLSSLLMVKTPQLNVVSDELDLLRRTLERGSTIMARMPYNISIH